MCRSPWSARTIACRRGHRCAGEFLTVSTKRWLYAAWLLLVAAFAGMHFAHLRADFPNHSPWMEDWAKYTDEGWYGNAAVRAHLLGHWYVPGDFNPAPAVPVWPLLEWLLFFATGVTIEAARGLAVSFFCADVLLVYLLVRVRGPRWAGLLAVTLAATSPFLYAFSRLAILEPMLLAFLLVGLNLAVRLPRMRRPGVGAGAIGVLFTLMLLTKTTAVFLLPALAWAMVAALASERRRVGRCLAIAGAAAAASFGGWLLLLKALGLLRDFRYLIFINTYPKPTEWYWPALSFWWSLRGAMWGGHILMIAGALSLGCVLGAWRAAWSRWLRSDPVWSAAALAAVGYLLFMTYQNHPQPRYYTVVALFACVLVSRTAQALLAGQIAGGDLRMWAGRPLSGAAVAGLVLVLAMGTAVARNAVWTLSYVTHPEYTFVTAAQDLTRYVDQHPNRNRLLLSLSGDEITLMTHEPSLCDDFGTEDLPVKIAQYQPGWWATWNDIDPGTLEDLHVHDSLEQVATFRALDHPERNELVLFKLHPLAKTRDPQKENLQVALAGDKIEIPIQ